MRMIVVGAGGTTRDLLRRLGAFWEVCVIDPDPARLSLAEKVRKIDVVLGDGSSRVVLTRADVEGSDALVAATNDDSVNLEATRLAREAGIVRVAVMAADPARLSEYRELDIPAYSPSRLAAQRIGIILEPRSVSSAVFADGLAEAMEILIEPGSPMRGRTLRELHSESWLVAAILRGGRLVVPRGDTMLETGDLVTVVGAAADYPVIVRSFAVGESRFPLEWGKRVAVALESERDLAGPLEAAINLTRNSSAESLLILHRSAESTQDDAELEMLHRILDGAAEQVEGLEVRMRAVSQPAGRALVSVARAENVGVLVVPGPSPGGFLARVRTVGLMRRLRSAGKPVLLARGEPGHSRVVVGVRDSASAWPAMRAAIDLARSSRTPLVGVAAVAPAYRGSSDDRESAIRAAARLRVEATNSGVEVRRRVRKGAPARIIEEEVTADSLVVLTMPRFSPTVFQPGVPVQIIHRVGASVMLIPRRGPS